jgi:hypothetical protein
LLFHKVGLTVNGIESGLRSHYSSGSGTPSVRGLVTYSRQSVFHDFGLLQVNDDLTDNRANLKEGAHRDSKRKTDIPTINTLLFRVLAGFFGGFFVAVCGACLYDKRRVLGASLIGLGCLSAGLALAYLLFGLSCSKCYPIVSDKQQQSYFSQHDGENVSQKYMDFTLNPVAGLGIWNMETLAVVANSDVIRKLKETDFGRHHGGRENVVRAWQI